MHEKFLPPKINLQERYSVSKIKIIKTQIFENLKVIINYISEIKYNDGD